MTDEHSTYGIRPIRRKRTGYTGLAREYLAVGWTNFIADTSNFHMLHYRHVDGFLVSAKNSGTHWLRFMLSHALAAQYDVEPPPRSTGSQADVLIGAAKRKRQYPELPHIALSHTIPSRAFSWIWVQTLFGVPPSVVLIRDIRKSLESIFVKWLIDRPDTDALDFAAYVEGDPLQRHPPLRHGGTCNFSTIGATWQPPSPDALSFCVTKTWRLHRAARSPLSPVISE